MADNKDPIIARDAKTGRFTKVYLDTARDPSTGQFTKASAGGSKDPETLKLLVSSFGDFIDKLTELNDTVNNVNVNLLGIKSSVEQNSIKEEMSTVSKTLLDIKDLIEKHFSSTKETKAEPKKRGRKKKESESELGSTLVIAEKQNKEQEKELFKAVISEIVKAFAEHIQSIQVGQSPVDINAPLQLDTGSSPKLLNSPVYDAEFVSQGRSKARRVDDSNIIDADYEDITDKPKQKRSNKKTKESSSTIDKILKQVISINNTLTNFYEFFVRYITDKERRDRERSSESTLTPQRQEDEKGTIKAPSGLLGIIYAGVAALAAAIWDTISLAIKVIKSVGGRILKFFPKVKTFLTNIVTKVTGFVSNILNVLQTASKGKGLGAKILTKVGSFFKSIGGFISNFLRYGRTVLRSLGKFSGVLTVVMAIFDFFRGFLNAEKFLGKDTASFGEKILTGLVSALTNLIYGTFKGLVELVDMIFGTSFGKFLPEVDDVISGILDYIIDFKDALVNVFKKGSLMISDLIYNVMDFIGSIISKIPGLGDFGKSLQDSAKSGKQSNQKEREKIDKESAENAAQKEAGRKKRDEAKAAEKAQAQQPTPSGIAQENKTPPTESATPTGSAAATGGQSPQRTSGSSDVLGVKNNNPGNIRATGTKWEGMIGENGGFVVFKDMIYGVRAIGKIMASYMKRGINTIRKAISTYAPPNENNTEQYIKFVSQQTGFDPDQPVNLTDPKILKPLVKAITQMEIGRSNAPDDSIIAKGISLVDKENIQLETPSGSELTTSSSGGGSVQTQSSQSPAASQSTPEIVSSNPTVGQQTASISAQNSGAVTASEVATPYAALAGGSGGNSTVINNNNASSGGSGGSGGSESTRNAENTFQKLQLLQAVILV